MDRKDAIGGTRWLAAALAVVACDPPPEDGALDEGALEEGALEEGALDEGALIEAALADDSSAALQSPLGTLPEPPSILRAVHILEDTQPIAPTIPVLHTSNDGRVAMDMRSPGKFQLFAPEKLGGHIWDQAAGTPISTSSVTYQGALHGLTSNFDVAHAALCDGTSQFPGVNGNSLTTTPRVCNGADCYDLSIITAVILTKGTATRSDDELQLWRAPVTVKVTAPKTGSAAISSITATANSNLTWSPVLQAKQFLEPMITSDGHLLVGRVETTMLDSVTKDPLNIVYAAHPVGASPSPCDVTQWTSLKAITRAPSDPNVNTKYGFARYPFRDAEGNNIGEGYDLNGTYPWLDREGRNIFFKTTSRSLYFKKGDGTYASTFEDGCADGVTCSTGDQNGYNEEKQEGWPGGTAVLGLWTHGRTVMLDGLVNNIDFGLGLANARHRKVKLYTKDGVDTWVRVGAGRRTDWEGSPQQGSPNINNSLIHSLEHLFNYDENMKPRTMRDVVWTMNTLLASEEIVFDEWIDPHALIVSDMMPSSTWSTAGPQFVYNDGYTLEEGFVGTSELRIQNAATAPANVRKVPTHGVVAGPARAEPVAMGGVFGRGFWLTGGNSITYAIPTQPATSNVWFSSIFLDARVAADTTARRVFTFPDNSKVNLVGRNELKILSGTNTLLASVTLPGVFGTSGYHHLGLLRTSTQVKIFFDGFLFHSFNISASNNALRLAAGNFVVGKAADATPGVKGWIDELRVLNEDLSPELACNHARGSLVRLTATASPSLTALANLYPSGSHSAIGTGQYVCRHDYAHDYNALKFDAASLENEGAVSVRDLLLFPEGPLKFGSSRPGSDGNAFCLTCHVDGTVDSNRSMSLRTEALTQGNSILMQNDPRRQPLQPVRLMFGLVPADLFGAGKPIANMFNSSGVKIDQFIFPQ